MADRSMQILPVAIGLTVSYLSAVSLLGVSSENYVYGTQYAVINISYGLATPFVVYLYMPVFFKIGKASAFEVNNLRNNAHFVLIDKKKKIYIYFNIKKIIDKNYYMRI